MSPVDKNGYDIGFGNDAVAPDGNSITYESLGAFAGNPDSAGLDQYLSSRTASGWSTIGIGLPVAATSLLGPTYDDFSGDLSHMVVGNGDPPLDGANPGTVNLYRRNPDGSFDLVTPGQPTNWAFTAGASFPDYDGASADFSHILFDEAAALTPGAPNNGVPDLYEWSGGQLSLVSVLPDGTPTNGSSPGPGGNGAGAERAISADGSRIYWGTQTEGSPLYLRQGGSTTAITASQCTTKPSCATGTGSGTWQTASTDGSKAFFTSNQQLTDDSTASSSLQFPEGDLYQYDADSGKLTDLTVDATDPNGADVQGVVGASDDGSYVYFVANGVLASGATLGSCNAFAAPDATCNLYVWHDGAIAFIATVDWSDVQGWLYYDVNDGPFQVSERAQVSADGLHMLFTSVAPPASGYDNAGHSEVYMYSAGSGRLTCVSCDPGGAPASGDAVLAAPNGAFVQTIAALPTLNNMSADGTRVFFETSEALLPEDTNGLEDVYEWEADGSGSCSGSADNGGCLYLISSGRSGSPSYFEDATPSGNDVFFLTREQLVGQDTDDNVDVYDARVGGGFPPPSPTPVPCSGEDCHGQPTSPPPPPVAATVTFVGPGNPQTTAHAAKVKVLRRVVRGSTFLLRVRVPGKGRVTISGKGIGTVRVSVTKAGTYRVKVTLKATEKAALKRKHKLELRLRATYAPIGGSASIAAFSLTVEPAVHRTRKHSGMTRQHSQSTGGAR